mmetsp:Transcript_17233/g.39411  ORF Transcript_17233/g.39411 Transcript_17233/m.39411 type:complete len:1860 (-) Transcript_17233:238-5817(-)
MARKPDKPTKARAQSAEEPARKKPRKRSEEEEGQRAQADKPARRSGDTAAPQGRVLPGTAAAPFQRGKTEEHEMAKRKWREAKEPQNGDAEEQAPKKAKAEKKTLTKEEVEASKAARVKPISKAQYIKGVQVLAVIKELNAHRMMVSMPYDCTASVSSEQAGIASGQKLTDHFAVGQYVAGVTLTEGEDKHRVLSLKPQVVNAGLKAEIFRPHMVLSANVAAVEEHTYELDFGIPGVRGLLPKKELSGTVTIGDLIRVEVKSGSTSAGLVKCQAHREPTPVDFSSGISIKHVRPGFVVDAVVELLQFGPGGRRGDLNCTGAMLEIQRTVPARLTRLHANMPDPRETRLNSGDTVTARVVAITPDDVVHLSLLPHVLSLEPSKLSSVDIGTKLEATITDVVERWGFRALGKVGSSRIPMCCPKFLAAVGSDGKLDSMYKVGTQCEVKIMKVAAFEGVYEVAASKELVGAEISSVGALKPGMILKAPVCRHVPEGVRVKFSDVAEGIIQMDDLADIPPKSIPERFAIDKVVKVRVLHVNETTRLAFCTAKRSFLNETTVVASFEDAANVDRPVTGCIRTVASNYVLVRFFGNVSGMIPQGELAKHGKEFQVGHPITVAIAAVNAAQRRMDLSLDILTARKPVSGDSSGIQAGEVITITECTEVFDDGIAVSTEGADGKAGTGFIPTFHLSDDVGQANAIRAALMKNKQSVTYTQGLVIDSMAYFTFPERSGALVSVKPAMLKALREGQVIPKTVDEVVINQMYTGYVKRSLEYGLIVSLGTQKHVSCLLHVKTMRDHVVNEPTEIADLHHTVRCVVSSLKDGRVYAVAKKSQMPIEEAGPADADMLQSYVSLQRQLLQTLPPPALKIWAKLRVGMVVEGKVADTKPYGVLISLTGMESLVALALNDQMPTGGASVGSKVRGVVLDADPLKMIVDVSLKPELVGEGTPWEMPSFPSFEESEELNATVEVSKPFYAVVSVQCPSGGCLLMSVPHGLNADKTNHPPGISCVVVVRKITKKPKDICARPLGYIKNCMYVIGAEKLAPGTVLTAAVKDVSDTRALIAVGGGVQGILHATQVSDEIVRNPFAEVKPGMQVTVRVLTAQMKEVRGVYRLEAALSMKPSVMAMKEIDVKAAGWYEYEDIKPGMRVPVVVRNVREEQKDAISEITSNLKTLFRFVEVSHERDIMKQPKAGLSEGELRMALVCRKGSPGKPEVTLFDKVPDLQDIRYCSVVTVYDNNRLPFGKKLLVQLPGQRLGNVVICDVKDDPNAEDPEFHVGQLLPCRVVAKTEQNQILVSLKKVHKKTNPLLEPVDPVTQFPEGSKVNGVVFNVGNGGVLLSITATVQGWIPLSKIAEERVELSQVLNDFPIGKYLTDAYVVKVKEGQVVLSIIPPGLDISHFSVGDTVKGVVATKKEYGLFIKISNSNIRALAHISELSDSNSVSIDSFQVGQKLRAKVMKTENGRLSLGLKQSYFEQDDEEGSEDDDQEEEEEEEERNDSASMGPGLLEAMEESDAEDEVKVQPLRVGRVGLSAPKVEVDSDDEGADKEDQNAEVFDSKKLVKRVKKNLKKKEQAEVDQQEQDAVEGLWRTNPQSVDDFERLLLTNGNSSAVWIKYMAHHLKLSELDKARAVAERAVSHISFREDQERFNAWIAYLNLEVAFGDKVDEVFKRACQFNDAKKIYLQMPQIWERNSMPERAAKAHATCVERYSQSRSAWIGKLVFEYNRGTFSDARQTLASAMSMLPKPKHAEVVTKAAQLEYSHGSPERGRTIFEELVTSNPKRLDFWSIYLDMEVKQHTPPTATEVKAAPVRILFERCTTLSLKPSKMKFFFKKWLGFEMKWGDEESQTEVKQKARDFVEKVAS